VEQEGQKIDPNISLQPYLVPFLQELRKVQIEWYRPDHPIALQFAQQRRIPPERLAEPSPDLLAQLARAWQATYVLRVRCAQIGAQFEYRAELWQLGRRSPLWSAEGLQKGGSDPGAKESVLQSLARTLALRLDTEVWADLPPTPPAPSSSTHSTRARSTPVQPPQDPAKLLPSLIQEARWEEAVLHLRSLIHRNPTETSLRLQLAQVYRRLNQHENALQELDAALQLSPTDSTLHLERVKLLRERNNLDEAVESLRSALRLVPDSEALRKALIESLLQGGQLSAAEAILKEWQGESPQRTWCAYLIAGATRRFEPLLTEPVQLGEEEFPVWLLVVSGALTDLANELLELRQQSRSSTPNWRALQARAEQHTLRTLRMSAWLEAVQPCAQLRQSVQRLRFSAQLLGQSSQHMARYLLQRRSEDEERASLLRLESLRELEAVRKAINQATP